MILVHCRNFFFSTKVLGCQFGGAAFTQFYKVAVSEKKLGLHQLGEGAHLVHVMGLASFFSFSFQW